MKPAEAVAYQAGARAMIDFARFCADALAPAAVTRPTRIGFAIGALEAFADGAEAILADVPDPRGNSPEIPDSSPAIGTPRPKPLPTGAGSATETCP